MHSEISPKGWVTILLGAINGLIAGVIASIVLYSYREYSNWRLIYGDLASEISAHFVQHVQPFLFIIVLCLFIVSFSIGSYIIHRFWFTRVNSIVWLWQYVGATAVLIGLVFLLTYEVIEYFSSGYTIFSYDKFLSLDFALFCLITLTCLAIINFCYGNILCACTIEYSLKVKGKSNLI